MGQGLRPRDGHRRGRGEAARQAVRGPDGAGEGVLRREEGGGTGAHSGRGVSGRVGWRRWKRLLVAWSRVGVILRS